VKISGPIEPGDVRIQRL
jgi:hypothetical protein